MPVTAPVTTPRIYEGNDSKVYPQNWLQLLILIAAVVPGFVYQISRRRVRGPGPDELSVSIRVLRAIATSVVFLFLYAIVFGVKASYFQFDSQGMPNNVRQIALWGFLLTLVVPWAAARIIFYTVTSKPAEIASARITSKLDLRRQWDPTPSAWDFAFANRETGGWVRVQTPEGDWVGGFYGGSSFASSHPDPREIYLETGYAMKADGTFSGEVSAPGGIYIRCDDARLVDFIPNNPEVEGGVADNAPGEKHNGLEGIGGPNDKG